MTDKNDEGKVERPKDPIVINCNLPGYKDCKIFYKSDGWKFKHLRLYENPTATAGELVALIVERIAGWEITESGEKIDFVPTDKKGNVNLDALDNLSSALMSWVTASFRDAYIKSASIFPS